MAEKRKILINDDNLDQFVLIDLGRSVHEIQKEKYDNDFDLEKQFNLERNRSRSFRIYGKISSTIIDCNDLNIEVYSDENYSDLYTTIQTSSYSFNTENIFRRKNGKYLIELNNFPFDVAFIRLSSDNFNYRDQDWEQRLVFYNTENQFINYGSSIFDFDTFGENSVSIENDFSFFFNKHWIRLDLDVKEEKQREISFSSNGGEILEGDSLSMEIYLNEPSPFGNETCLFNISSPSSNYPYYYGEVSRQVLERDTPNQNPLFRNSNGSVYFYTYAPNAALGLLRANSILTITSGDYEGEHVISDVGVYYFYNEATGIYYKKVTLDTPFNPDAQIEDGGAVNYNIGFPPDISVLLNGVEIEFPYPMSWEEGEVSKNLRIIANDDLDIEMKEDFTFSFTEKYRLIDGLITVSQIYVLDRTERLKTIFNVGGVYKNRLLFEGRSASVSNSFTRQFSSPSILRNGALWQGVNAEFYPCDNIFVKIKNEGLNSILPINPTLGSTYRKVFLSGEEKVFRFNMEYENSIPHKIKATYTRPSGLSLGDNNYDHFVINGVKIPIQNQNNSYEKLKINLDGGQNDYFKQQGYGKDFSFSFNNEEKSVIFSSKDGGGFLSLETSIDGWAFETLQEYVPSLQKNKSFELHTNTVDQKSHYRITFYKNGYRSMIMKPQFLSASEDGENKYLVNVLGNILAPYDAENEECFYLNKSIYHVGNYLTNVSLLPSSQDILTTLVEGGEERGYGGTPMPLHDKVYTNHIALLSQNTLSGSKRNLTTYGRFNQYGSLIESPHWASSPVEVIPSTSEEVVSSPTKKVMDINISLTSPSAVSGARGFDFLLNGETFYKIGGTSSPYSNKNANYWWENGDGVIVATPDNESVLGNPSMGEVLDGGDNNGDFGGLVDGVLVESNKLRLKSKFFAQEFSIDNISQFESTPGTLNFNSSLTAIQGSGVFGFSQHNNVGYASTNNDSNLFKEEDELNSIGLYLPDSHLEVLRSYLNTKVRVPNLLIGDENIGRNGLGGFSYQI